MGLSDLVQKAVYIGIGAASYAGEKAGSKLNELSGQLQKLADEMVERGEMTAEEARRYVDEKMKAAQKDLENLAQSANIPTSASAPTAEKTKEPRRIEIIDEDEEPMSKSTPNAAAPSQSVSVSPDVRPEAPNPSTTSPKKPVDPIEEMRRQVAELQDELRRLRS